jgi:hypothetical protein
LTLFTRDPHENLAGSREPEILAKRTLSGERILAQIPGLFAKTLVLGPQRVDPGVGGIEIDL